MIPKSGDHRHQQEDEQRNTKGEGRPEVVLTKFGGLRATSNNSPNHGGGKLPTEGRQPGSRFVVSAVRRDERLDEAQAVEPRREPVPAAAATTTVLPRRRRGSLW